MSQPTSPSTPHRTALRDGVISDTDTDPAPVAKPQRRIVSDSGKGRSGTCEDALDVEDTKAKAARELASGISKCETGINGKRGGVKQITDSANLPLESLMDELGTGFSNGSPSPTLSPGSSRAQSPEVATATSASPISKLSGVAGTQDGTNPLFSVSQLPPIPPIQQETNTPAVAPFVPGGPAKNNNISSPTPSLCGSKFTPLKRVKKGPASVNNNQPATPGDVHTHTKRPSITSGTTEVASTSPGAIDAADYGIHGKKLATMFANPAPGTPPPQSIDGTEVTPDLVLLHISLIIPPNSSPAYARHQRKMLRRKRLDDESSTLSASDLGYSDEDATGDDADSDNLEPGPLSMLSPVVYQRGILIPHPRGDYVLLQREVGKTLGLPFVNGEDGENVATDEFGGVQGKGWQMRVYARNGWLTKGAWERAWREMERVDVEILETERARGKQMKSKARKTKTKQIQGIGSESGLGSRSGSHLRDGYTRLVEQSSHFPPTGGDAIYSDPEDSLDEDLPAGNLEVDDNDAGHTGIYENGITADTGEKDSNTLEDSDVEDIERSDTTPIFPRGVKRAPLQLENGTVGDGELEEAYRAHGENLDDPIIDEEYANDVTDLQDTPPSVAGSAKESYSVPHSRSASPAGLKKSQVRGKSPNSNAEGKRQVHPYQYILDLLKPIVLTGLVVTGAMYFFGPTHKRNGRYGSWNMRSGKQIHDEENFDMDQDVEDHCAGYAREAEMWRSWKDSHKDGGSSSGAMLKKGVHGDWTVTVTQTVTQRIVNAGATQIVVEIPSGEAQFPLGPLGLSERETQDSEELPLETATDGLPALPLPTSATDGSDTSAELKAVDGEAQVGEDGTKLDVAPDSEENTEEEAAEGIADPEEALIEDSNTGGNWFGKIGKIF